MSIAPFSTRPAPGRPGAPETWWRTRLAVVSATVGIAATLLAYAISPGLRHAVVHAERSVRHAVSRVFDRDAGAHKATHAAKALPTAPNASHATRTRAAGHARKPRSSSSATRTGTQITVAP